MTAVFGGAEDQVIQKDSNFSTGTTFTMFMGNVWAEVEHLRVSEPQHLNFVSKYKGKELTYSLYKNIPPETHFQPPQLNSYLTKCQNQNPYCTNVAKIQEMTNFFMNKSKISDAAIKNIPILKTKAEYFIRTLQELDIQKIPKEKIYQAQQTFEDLASLIQEFN